MPTYWTPDMDTPDLLNATELAARLGVKATKFARLKKAGMLRMFEVSRPLGQRRYSRAKVEEYVKGESIAAFGRGSRGSR